MTTCRLTQLSPAQISSSRTSTSPTTALTGVWHPTLWAKRTLTTSFMCAVSSKWPSSSVSPTSSSFTHSTTPSETHGSITLISNDISFPSGHVLIWPFCSWNLLLISLAALSLWWNCCPPFSERHNGLRAILKRICAAMRIFKWTYIQFMSVAREANSS